MTKIFKDIKEACWSGYKQVGMKKKNGKEVPNCVPDPDNKIPKQKTENATDAYKGKLNKDQIATIKNTWKDKTASDVTQGVKDMVKKYDIFTRMDIKKANIKHISNLINDEVQQEEVDFITPLLNETQLKEFTTDQINRLAKSYATMSGKTISLANADKLRKMMDMVPDSSLNALRKKKIPFISGLALTRMIQKKMPITEADLTKSQTKQVDKLADELPKKDFIKRYGKDGDAVRYATATNQIKNKFSLGEDKFKLKGVLTMNESYKTRLTTAMEHYKISSLADLKEEDHKPFFAYVDGLKESTKKEELSAGQKKLPPALQKAIAAKQGDKKDDKKEVKEGEMPQAALDALKKSKEKKEDLVGGQKKLDKDKDGDIDKHDMAKLRAMKKESVSSVKPEVTAKDSNKTAHEGGDQKEKTDADMSKVKDAPAKSEPHKKIEADKKMTEDHDCEKVHPSASHKEYATNQVAKEYAMMASKKNTMKKENHGRYLQTKPGSLEEAVLKARGLIK